eukprot:Phypoly_transcript_03872.p1 GENE.Phypoly_transcript_03872~~Phypoly_transcript_03872.p1  ORF type:complete len:750 (+),score=116.50 Phypoly_transcript_03872:49-2298(+)
METPSLHSLLSLGSQPSSTNLLESSDTVRQYLHNINHQILEVQKQIHSLVSENNESFTNTLLYCKQLKNEANALHQRFDSIAQLVDHPEKGLFTSLIAEITNYHALQSSIAVHEDEISILDNLYTHYRSISDFDKLFATKDYISSASILSRASEVQGGNLRIHAVLADEYRSRRNAMKKILHETLRGSVHGLVVSSNDKRLVSNISEKYTLQLQQSIYPFLRAIEILGEKETTTAFTYLSQTIGDFFKYFLSDASNLVSLEHVSDEWRFLAETTPTKLEHVPPHVVLHILGQCQEALGIIAKFVFEENTAYISRLGGAIWDDITNNIIKKLLATSIPEDNSQLAEYKAIINSVEALENTAQKLGYITSDHPLAASMSKYSHDVDSHFALKKQRRLLSKARKLLINADHNLTVTVGTPESIPELSKLVTQRKPAQNTNEKHAMEDEESLLKLIAFPQCVVSHAAHELVTLIHQALHAHFAGENQPLYNTSMVTRSMVDLFRVVYSSHHKKLADVPQLSIIFHNDCFYIAQCISLILQPGEHNTESFVDLVHSLRELGEASWMHTTTKQVEQVKETLEAMGGLADVQEAKRKQIVDRTFKIISRQLKAIGETLKGVLSLHLYFTTIGIIVNNLFSTLIQEVENIEAISEEESHILHTLLQNVLQDCDLIFKSTLNQGTPNERVNQFLLNKYVPQWTKYTKAVDLLEMPLIKIVEYYKNGLLDEFQPIELRQLIQGLFSDSPLRKQLLDQLT